MTINRVIANEVKQSRGNTDEIASSPLAPRKDMAIAWFFVMGIFLFPISTSAASLGSEVIVDGSHADSALAKPFVLIHGTRKFEVPAKTLRAWVRKKVDGDTTFLRLSPGHIYTYLNTTISPVVNTVGASAKFVFRNGALELKEGGRKGSIVDGVKTSMAIRDAVAAGKSSATVFMKPYTPPITSVADAKKLGIREKIARGESSFAGSPRNRAKNIDVGRLKFQGILVAPEEEFSFNSTLGPVTAETGYLPELVIKENVTTPEYGGGLCQVSTTLFRAAVNAGLDVTLRRQHAYPVKYYGKPGFDATIYTGFPDLRFKNTTGNWILLQTSIEGTKLFFDVYGAASGRTVTIDGPHVIEKKPDGSMRTLLRQTVKDATGKVIHDELFPSTYKSPDLFPRVREKNGET